MADELGIVPDKHCMVDIETLGLHMGAPVIQIGMVFFTRQGILIQSQLTIDFDDALKYGIADGSTVKWWLERPKEAQNTLFVNPRPVEECADIMVKLMEAQNPNYYWAHENFDFSILHTLFRNLGRKQPFPHRRCFGLRTLEFLAGPIEWEQREGVYHNALDDATYQAKHAIKLLNNINKG